VNVIALLVQPLAWRASCFVCVAWLVVACTRQPPALDLAVQAASTHLSAFHRFEVWADRVLHSDVALRGDQALREAAFAPLRGDDSIVWAELRDERGQLLVFGQTIETQTLGFLPISADELGTLQVAQNPCPTSHSHEKDNPQTCVVIMRPDARLGISHAQLRMAFRDVPSVAESARAQVSNAVGRGRAAIP
jgi:hypothetical protein